MEFEDQLELIKEYVTVSIEFLNEYEALLLKMETSIGGEPDPEVIREILSQLHTFKGNSGMMGFSSIQKYTHKLEDVFKAVQNRVFAIDEDLADMLINSEAVLRSTVNGINVDKPEDPDLGTHLDFLEDFMETHSTQHKEEQKEPSAKIDMKKKIESFSKRTNVLKVDFERLDHLMNLMGELVIHRTRLGRIESIVREEYDEKGISLDLTDATDQIGKLTTELHEAIMKVRMLPIRQVLMRFPRMVRDLSREKGKEISLSFEGEETELDKTVIDEIGEPLMHLLRNSIDHGIEPPEEREKNGKQRQGHIFIRAYQESNNIIITIEDDGRGLDEDRIIAKAISLGLTTREELQNKNWTDFIFLPGFSTAEKITEVSGRGVGMDAVKKSLAKINGVIEVQSEKNFGTRFTIKLPLTLAIISALMIQIDGEQYAVPLSSVIESVKLKNDEVHFVNGKEVFNIRDTIMPLLRLSKIFGLKTDGDSPSLYAVIVQSSLGRVGLIVDSLLGQQEIVIKALDDLFGNASGIAGATILGDGKVVLIVDVFEVMEQSGRRRNTSFMETMNVK